MDCTATLLEVSQAMKDHGVGIVPVTDGGHLTGVITYQDLAVRTTKESNRARPLTAKDIMSPNPIIVSQETEAKSAVQVMRQHNIRHLLISGDDETVTGVMSIEDIRRQDPQALDTTDGFKESRPEMAPSHEENYLPGHFLG